MGNAGKTIFAQFIKMRKMKDDKQKKVIPQSAIDTEFFHRAFANPCTM
jgi:hypothetical protein